MFRKACLSILCIAILHSTFLYAQTFTNTYIYCAPELQNSLQIIQKLKEGKLLIAHIVKKGPIRIVVAYSSIPQEFGACWDSGKRTIYVSLSSHKSQGEIIGSIIFEMHNALNTDKLQYLDYLASVGEITKEDYIREIEYVEYENSIEAEKLIHLGIQKRIFPKSARLNVYDSFDDHFYYQQIEGHSAVIAENYDHLAPSPYYAYYKVQYWPSYFW